MSEPWSKRHEVDRLADGQVEYEFAIPLAGFPRLKPQLARVEGSAGGVVRFVRERGLAVAELRVRADAWLVCQRCLGPALHELAGESRIVLAADAAAADAVPQELDAVIVEGGCVSVRELVEEELLLELPLVPLHQDPAQCLRSSQSRALPDEAEQPATQKPFAQLGELLKRDQ